ncbi:hypothetical protein [Sphingorhabdus sp.]|uniref:hypothetical protein n=1 Tax=Sphingorhabdus sp. TaxID=1902408 RepID=UPI0032B80936
MFVNVATEDELSEAVAVRLVTEVFGDGKIGNRLGRKGNGYLRTKIGNFRQMANREPVLILTDLDDTSCAPNLIEQWSGGIANPENLLLRVVVRETEAWLLADRKGIADFLGVSPNRIPLNPESIQDPKRFLLNLARSAKRDVRSELIVSKGVVASQGLGYNRLLSAFVSTDWGLTNAAESSNSLYRAMTRLVELAARIPD